MKVKDAEWVKLYLDNSPESEKAKEVLTEKGILFGERRWRGDFSVQATILGKGEMGDKKLVVSTTLSPPILEVYFGPGKYLVLGGFDRISEGIESEW